MTNFIVIPAKAGIHSLRLYKIKIDCMSNPQPLKFMDSRLRGNDGVCGDK